MAKARTALLVAAGLTVLLAVAGAASHGRPLSVWGRGHGPTPNFLDYAFTTLLVLLAAGMAIAIYGLTQSDPAMLRRNRRPLWKSMAMFLALIGLALAVAHFAHIARRLAHDAAAHRIQPGSAHNAPLEPKVHGGRSAAIRWDEVAVFALLAAAAAAYALRRRSGRTLVPPPEPELARADVTALLDDAVDDLRNEQDVRRAIIAAYARMEIAFEVHGLPRRRSEAPREFLERALLRLDVSRESVRRLTDLFEWAKFSHHEPDPETKDEAIDALLAVRDELRTPVPVPA